MSGSHRQLYCPHQAIDNYNALIKSMFTVLSVSDCQCIEKLPKTQLILFIIAGSSLPLGCNVRRLV